ncbi:MAG: glycosyltransferase family 4 protein [Nitrospiraceae bacterium]|nr:MAG: glycosyltransferase family 4 protein [Nitrospiraceae bacterium]
MKEVLIDLYKIRDLYSGLGQFSRNYANELLDRKPRNFNIHFLCPKINREMISGDFHCVDANFQKRYLPFLNRKYDIWHSLHQFPSFLPGPRTKLVLTVHDLNFLIEKGTRKANKYLNRLQCNIKKACAVIFSSAYTKNIASEHLDFSETPTHVIHIGVTLSNKASVTRPHWMKEDRFFFSIGVVDRKKNFHVLIPLMEKFPDYHLVIAGNKNSSYAQDITKQIKELGLEERIIMPGKVTDDERNWLYANCRAFLFPSLAEGFGLPAVEALMNNKPVFLSRETSLPEIGGDAAFFFDSFERDSMAEVVMKGLSLFRNNQEEYKAKIADHVKQFTWDTCIEKHLHVYQQVMAM